MRALSLCQSCKRHIRVSESACPFCGAAHTPAIEATTLKPRGRPGGRAALFLAGAASAPGCADEPSFPEQSVPIYGAPIDPDASSRASDGGPTTDARDPMPVPPYGISIPVYGIPIDRDAGADANTCGTPQAPMATPVYGVPLDAGAAGDAGLCGSDGGVKDSGPLGTPPYGVSVDNNDAGPRDAGRRDAALRDGEILVTPVYGLWLEEGPEE